MEYKNAIVIDSNGYKVTNVLACMETGIPLYYIMQDGESLITKDILTALKMVKPKWDGTVWEETATPEEIEEAQRQEGLAVPSPFPSLEERMAALESLALAALMGGMEHV